MTIPNRTVSIKSVFASTANTTIPTPPATGVSYRNTGTTAAEIGEGWPYKEIVDSAKFNQAMYEYTTICQQLEKYGFLPWSPNTDYLAGGCALGSDGNVYQAKVNTGPGSTALDPVSDTNHNIWDLFYYSTFPASKALVSNADGKVAASSVTSTELSYLSGVTSGLQTQINNKAENNAVMHLTGNETIAGTKTFQNQTLNQSSTSTSEGTHVDFTQEINSARRGTLRTMYNSDGSYSVMLGNNGPDAISPAGITVIRNATKTWAEAPSTPDIGDNSRKIATTAFVNNLLSSLYPVGSIYIGTQSTCPLATLISGSTWTLVAQDRALWGGNGSNANTTIAAGLPNITGNIGVSEWGESITSGAFRHDGAQLRNADWDGGASTFTFNASRSSSIYGQSTTVQPPAYRVNVWRRTA